MKQAGKNLEAKRLGNDGVIGEERIFCNFETFVSEHQTAFRAEQSNPTVTWLPRYILHKKVLKYGKIY